MVSETLVVQAEIAELARVGDWIETLGQRCALRQSVIFAMHLCLEEAVSNIIRHGFAESRDGDRESREVRLAVEERGDAIVLTVEDTGKPFDPFKVPPRAKPTTIENVSEGGWGIPLMTQFARRLAYERSEGINRLTLCFDR